LLLADTNILSTLAKINQLSLLFQLFHDERIGVVVAVYEECVEGVNRGYAALQSVIGLIGEGRIELVLPTANETFAKADLPPSFDAGERETITVASSRSNEILTNERHVRNWCHRSGIGCWDLSGILRALWRDGILNKQQVRDLMVEIEAKDRVVFKNADQIFQE